MCFQVEIWGGFVSLGLGVFSQVNQPSHKYSMLFYTAALVMGQRERIDIFPVVFEVNCGRMEEQTLGINLLQELASSNQLSCGEKPLQFVLPFSSFSCPGLLALLPWETGSPLPAKHLKCCRLNIHVEWEVGSNCWQQGDPVNWNFPGTQQPRGEEHGFTTESQLCQGDQLLLQILSRHRLSIFASQRKGWSLVSCIKVVYNLWGFLIHNCSGRSL